MASVWMPAKACQCFYNGFTLFQHFQFYSTEHTELKRNILRDVIELDWKEVNMTLNGNK